MVIVCPNCQKKQNMRPDELLGRFFICRRCGRICRWGPTETEGSGSRPSGSDTYRPVPGEPPDI